MTALAALRDCLSYAEQIEKEYKNDGRRSYEIGEEAAHRISRYIFDLLRKIEMEQYESRNFAL